MSETKKPAPKPAARPRAPATSTAAVPAPAGHAAAITAARAPGAGARVQGGGRRTLIGRVVSDKMQKTVVVEVVRRQPHPRYGKYVVGRERFKAHDEQGVHTGDRVEILESRPMSRDKRWRVLRRVAEARAAELEPTPGEV